MTKQEKITAFDPNGLGSEDNNLYGLPFLEEGGNVNENEELKNVLDTINKECHSLHQWVKAEASKLIAQNKFVGVLGGDHSTPLGLMQALASRYEYGILHIDA